MTHTPTQFVPSPRRLSDATRVVHAIVRLTQSCDCGTEARIVVLHGPDEDGVDHALEMRRRLLAKLPDATVALELSAPDQEAADESTHRCATVDVTARETSRALIGYRWEPNQPDTGRLDVLIDGVSAALHAGVGIEVRVTDAGLGVWVIEDNHQRSSRVGPAGRRVDVCSVDGIHLLYRDEARVGDSPARVSLVLDDRGGVRRLG